MLDNIKDQIEMKMLAGKEPEQCYKSLEPDNPFASKHYFDFKDRQFEDYRLRYLESNFINCLGNFCFCCKYNSSILS